MATGVASLIGVGLIAIGAIPLAYGSYIRGSAGESREKDVKGISVMNHPAKSLISVGASILAIGINGMTTEAVLLFLVAVVCGAGVPLVIGVTTGFVTLKLFPDDRNSY